MIRAGTATKLITMIPSTPPRRDHEQPVTIQPRHHHRGPGQHPADDQAGGQHRPPTLVRLADRGPDPRRRADRRSRRRTRYCTRTRRWSRRWRWPRARMTAPEVEVAERGAAQTVLLEVVHGDPDPGGRHQLDEQQSPVEDQQLDAAEQQDQGAGGPGDRRQVGPGVTELHRGRLDRPRVDVGHGLGQAAPGCRPGRRIVGCRTFARRRPAPP